MECGTALQRLFSTFANGWPGTGLLLLRISVFSYLIFDACAGSAGSHIEHTAPRIVAAVAGVFLVVGFWTPLAGALAAIVELWLGLSNLKDIWPPIAASAIAAGLTMLGPGAWSLDARLFGRKRISFGGR